MGKCPHVARPQLVCQRDYHILVRSGIQRGQPFQYLRSKPTVSSSGRRVGDLTATQRIFRRTEHEEIPFHHGNRLVQQNLNPTLSAGRQPVGVQQADAPRGFRGEKMESDPFVVFQGMGSALHHTQKCVEPPGRLQPTRIG